jgi:hypothetical protein
MEYKKYNYGKKIIYYIIYLYITYYIILKKKIKAFISYSSSHFSWHNQILKTVLQLIFHDTAKYQEIIHFIRIYFQMKITFQKKNYFQQTNRAMIVLDFTIDQGTKTLDCNECQKFFIFNYVFYFIL